MCSYGLIVRLVARLAAEHGHCEDGDESALASLLEHFETIPKAAFVVTATPVPVPLADAPVYEIEPARDAERRGAESMRERAARQVESRAVSETISSERAAADGRLGVAECRQAASEVCVELAARIRMLSAEGP